MLQIEPFASLVNTVRSTVPRLLLNRHAVGPFERVPLRRGDHIELGDLVASVRRFAEMLGWDSEIKELMSAHETQVDRWIRFISVLGHLRRLMCIFSITFLQSVPVLMSRPPSVSGQTCQSGAANSPGKTEAPGDGARSSGDESDSETDSKSSASSTLSS